MGDTVFTNKLYACSDCGALVLPEHKAQHERWHDRWHQLVEAHGDAIDNVRAAVTELREAVQ